MRINTNVSALSAHRNLSKTGVNLGKSIERLSSGLRINRAGDDAAGLVISEKLRAESSGLRQSVRNAQDGISFVQTAEGALDEVSGMLNRMRDLSVQYLNGTQDTQSQAAIQAEFDALAVRLSELRTLRNLLAGMSSVLQRASRLETPPPTSSASALLTSARLLRQLMV